MTYQEVNEEYLGLIESDPKRYEQDLRRLGPRLENSKAIFRGKVVPFIYKPLLFSQDDVENFQAIVKKILKIGDKIVDEYLVNKDFRKKFNFPKELEDLILIEPGYHINVPMARIDIFYKDGDDFKFCEINTDGSSAMLEDNSFAEISLDSQAIKDLEARGYSFKSYELIDSWVEKSLEIYQDWEHRKYESPNVAILDLRESATSVEFEEFKKAYERKGLRAEIVDPRELSYRDGNLYKGDFRIDLIYRRLVTFEMMENFQHMTEFVRAYKAGAVCTIGSLRSQLLHNKIIFKVLHDKDSLRLMTEEEQDFIKRHIPFTAEFKGGQDVFDHVLKNKDKYIMKPSDMNVGSGVYVGRDLKQDQWEESLAQSFNRDYIYQEFIEPYRQKFPVYREGEFIIQDLNPVIGLFSYKEDFAGLYTRLGRTNVVSSTNSARSANLIFSKK